MTEEEMDRLEYLRQDDFNRGEWVFACGKPEGPMIDEYNSVFAQMEKEYHLKLVRAMNFANRLRLTLGGRPFRREGSSCSLDRRKI